MVTLSQSPRAGLRTGLEGACRSATSLAILRIGLGHRARGHRAGCDRADLRITELIPSLTCMPPPIRSSDPLVAIDSMLPKPRPLPSGDSCEYPEKPGTDHGSWHVGSNVSPSRALSLLKMSNRPATLVRRETLFREAAAIHRARLPPPPRPEHGGGPDRDLAAPAAARVPRGRPHDLPRRTSPEVRMQKALELLREGSHARSRGRAQRGLSPARPVREDLPPPPRRAAVELPPRRRRHVRSEHAFH